MPSPLVVLLFLMSKISLNFSHAPSLPSLSLPLSRTVTALLQIFLPVFLLFLYFFNSLCLLNGVGEGGNNYFSTVSISAFLMSLSNKHTRINKKVIISEKLNLAKCHQGQEGCVATYSAVFSHLEVKATTRDVT